MAEPKKDLVKIKARQEQYRMREGLLMGQHESGGRWLPVVPEHVPYTGRLSVTGGAAENDVEAPRLGGQSRPYAPKGG